MIKKNLLSCILVFFYTFSLFGFEFKANDNVTIYTRDENFIMNLKNKKYIEKGTVITFSNDYPLLNSVYLKKANETLAFINGGSKFGGYISINSLILKNESCLPKGILSVKEIGVGKRYIPEYMLDVLRSGDTKKVTEYDSYYASEYHDFLKNDLNSYIAYGFEKKFYYAVISNIGIKLHSDDNFIFTNIKKISPTKYECIGVGFSEWDPYRENTNYWQTYFENTSELEIESEIIELTIDGDYLTIFNKTRNKEIITLVCINDSVEKQLIDLFKTEKCDLSKVTWPRHADGTCDYEASSTAKEASFPSNNVALNKTMSVTENLKLRSDEATSTQVLTVMSVGTKVKILELGKAENIDGISSNWVKVEVQSGATDKDGKEIKNGTVGWCYGGYLE